MTKRRDAVLGLLGIERWSLKGVDAALPETPLAQDPPGVLAAPVAAPAPIASPASIVAPPVISKVEMPVVTFEVSRDWPTLREQVAGCRRCKLCETRTHTVFGAGHEASPLMVVGEGPGADEDASGEPFVGRAGKLLDEMLKAIGRSRAVEAPAGMGNVFIANVVKCRPPGNRDPEKDEVEACRQYLDAQIAHVRPKLIVALGRIAAQRLLSNDEPLSRLRGPLHHYGPTQTPVFVTYHPAYLLRSPKEKAKSWEDLKKIAQHLKAHG